MNYTEDDRDTVVICNNYIYRHKVLRVNYTTYDLRRSQDSINPRTHPDIMLLSHDDEPHPYWYARVIGIFHVDVIHTGPLSKSPHKKRVDFLFVWWFGRELDYRAGWLARRLHRIVLELAGSWTRNQANATDQQIRCLTKVTSLLSCSILLFL